MRGYENVYDTRKRVREYPTTKIVRGGVPSRGREEERELGVREVSGNEGEEGGGWRVTGQNDGTRRKYVNWIYPITTIMDNPSRVN